MLSYTYEMEHSLILMRDPEIKSQLSIKQNIVSVALTLIPQHKIRNFLQPNM